MQTAHLGAACLVWVLLSAPSSAEAPLRIERDDLVYAVARASGAARHGDETLLRRVASISEPDPWLVADALRREEGPQVAAAFAVVYAGSDADALRRYVAAPSSRDAEAAGQVRLALAGRAGAERRFEDALLLADPEAVPAGTVVALRLAAVRLSVLRVLERWEDARALEARWLPIARELGWRRGLARLLRHAAERAAREERWAEAHALVEEGVLQAAELADDPTLAECLQWSGTVHRVLGADAKALEAFARLEQVGHEAKAPLTVALGLVGRAQLLQRAGRTQQAVTMLESAAALQVRAGRVSDAFAVLGPLASGYAAMNRLDAAQATREHVLRMADEIVARDRAPGALVDLAYTCIDQGTLASARAHVDRAAVLLVGREGTHEMARVLRVRAMIADVAGDFVAAVAHARAELAVMERRGSPAEIAMTWSFLGGLLRQAGAQGEAEQALRRAYDLARKDGSPRLIAELANNLASFLHLTDRMAEAARLYESALEAMRSLADPATLLTLLSNYSMLRSRLGDASGAMVLAQEALGLGDTAGAPNDLAFAWYAVATAAKLSGEYQTELKAHLRALYYFEQAGDVHGQASAWTNLGQVYSHRGRVPEMDAAFAKALELRHRIGDPDGVARTLLEVGNAKLDSGRLEEAIAVYRSALKGLGEVTSVEARPMLMDRLADALLANGQAVEALGLLQQVANVRLNDEVGLSDIEIAGLRTRSGLLWENGIAAATMAQDAEALAWFLEVGRAGALRAALREGGDLEGSVVPSPLRTAEQQAENLVRERRWALRQAIGGGLSRRKPAREALQAAEDGLLEARQRIVREARAAADLTQVLPDDIATLQARCATDEAIVLYGLREALLPGAFVSHPYATDAVALVIERNAARIVTLGSSGLTHQGAESLVKDEPPYVDPRKVSFLKRRVADKLELGPHIRRVIVSPSGRLAYVPFCLLFPDHEVACVPSGTVLGILEMIDGARTEASDAGVLGLGDPAYGASPRPVGRPLRPLDATRAEVEAVADVRLLGADATVRGLQAALAMRPRWRAVHLACHGLVDTERPLFSSLAFTPDGEHDGRLAAFDVLRMRIPADLVVLSACDTARGKIHVAEGVVGLMRAFMQAGAPRIICSLWKVDDRATAALFTKFYALWNPRDGTSGMQTASALREAQRYVAAQPGWEHPTFWAAWTLWGLPR